MDKAHREQIAALAAAVADLQAEVEHLRKGRIRAMRETHRCSACGGTRLLHFKRIKDVAEGRMVDLALQKEFSAWWGVKLSAAALEAFACRNCRLVEWHAISLDDVQPDGDEVVELEGSAPEPPSASPYR